MLKFDLNHDVSDVTINCDNTIYDENLDDNDNDVDYLRSIGYYSDDEDEDEDEDNADTPHESQVTQVFYTIVG